MRNNKKVVKKNLDEDILKEIQSKINEVDLKSNGNNDDDENEPSIQINPLEYIVYVVGDITMRTAIMATQQMIALDKFNTLNNIYHPITMIINSGGGSVNAAWQICDVMDYIKTPVYTTGLGEIASAALMIFMNGEPGHRVITEKTSVMSHLYSWGAAGSHNNLISVNKEFQSIYDRMLKHYMSCTGLTKKVIEKELLCEHDVWLTADEALKLNITDEVIKTKIKRHKKRKIV
jgi:ATP-dependent Clp protease protease subunit